MACAAILAVAASAQAETAPEAAPPPEPASAEAKPKPAPYSLPWMLRPAVAGNVVRLDATLAFSKTQDSTPILALASYKVLPNLAAIVRLGMIHNKLASGDSATSFVNPALGVLYAIPIGTKFKSSLFGAVTLPVGSGGGDNPDLAKRTASLSGIFARASMDNALFQINYMTPMVGASIAYVHDGITLQAEATVLELIRVRGSAVDKDAARTNITAGLHFGWFPAPWLSIGTELRYQYWASHPTIQAKIDETGNDAAKDHVTLGFGPRAHFKIKDKMWLRPGVSLTMGLDLPTGFGPGGSEYKLVQIDVPLAF